MLYSGQEEVMSRHLYIKVSPKENFKVERTKQNELLEMKNKSKKEKLKTQKIKIMRSKPKKKKIRWEDDEEKMLVERTNACLQGRR